MQNRSDPVATLIARYFDWLDGEVLATYHAQNLGYGTLFKICTIVERMPDCSDSMSCAAAMQRLIAEFKSGVDVGELYRRHSWSGG